VRFLFIAWVAGALVGGRALAQTNQVASGNPATRAVEPSAVNAVLTEAQQLQKVMDNDDAAQGEVDQWIRENEAFEAKGVGTPPGELKRRIQTRMAEVGKGYEDFLQRYPNNVKARIAYASFLGDTKDEESAETQLEKALALDTNNPAIYNNLANIYGHIGSVKKAFEYYARAIKLNPIEPVYYHNLGTTVYLFRPDAEEYYGISEDQVFAKAFELYSNAMRLDPENFPLASDVAQTYYGIRPLRTEPALQAWTNALHLAHDEIEREGVYIHFARIKLLAGRFVEAQKHLDAITNEMYMELKHRIQRNLDEAERQAKGTNAPPLKTGNKG
jgi:tetratricopeptide (TPR) repeat protein